MYTVKSSHEVRITINKSEFISQIFPINDVNEAQVILTLTRKKYSDATHNCYAYIIGSNIIKCSDDGEPSQTAGVVILEVLKKNNLSNVLCIVTRYFGGIKLGAGGLIRAYSNSAKQVVLESEFSKIIIYEEVSFVVSYNNYNLISNYLENVCFKEFLDNVSIICKVNKENVFEFKSKLQEITKNQITFK